MIKQSTILLATVSAVLMFAAVGCSDSKPASVTQDIEQSEIDAYKAQEKAIEEEAAAEMDLE